jgi:ribosomal protein S18 acetylase RimI-like enzyme
MNYRIATVADKAAFQELCWISYSVYAQYMTPENAVQHKKDMYSDEIWDNILATSRGFVCEDEGKIVGMAFITPSGNPNHLFKSEWSYIRRLGIDPNYKGQGIATHLMQQCIDHAKANNEKIVALHTMDVMTAARHIYEKMGFTILEEIPPIKGLKFWLYTKALVTAGN